MKKEKSNIKKNILIIGTSGHAKVIIDIVEREGKYNIFGLIDTYKEIGGKTFEYSILGTENYLPTIMAENDIYGGIIAIGDNNTRKKVYDRIAKIDKNFNFVNAIHPKTVIGSSVKIGFGVAIMPGVIINTNATISNFCILNTKSILGSQSLMSDYSSLGPGTNLGENVSIGVCTAISLGAKIIENINIGSHSVIGAGSIVVNDISNEKIAFGIPAKEIRDRKKGEFYLSGNRTKTSKIVVGDKTNILITSAGRRVSLVKSFLNEVSSLKIKSKVFCSDFDPKTSAACQIADKYFKTPKISGKNYIDRLIKICNRNNIKLIIPTIDTELKILAENRKLFLDNGIDVLVSDISFVEKCRDKRLIHQFFDELKFNRAYEYSLDNIKFPAFVKPSDGSSSRGLYLLNKKSELTEEILSNQKNMFLEYFNPKLHDEYTVDIYFNKQSKIICVVPRLRILVRDGEVNKGCTRKNEIVEFVRTKFKGVKGLKGCITLQVFKHKSESSIYGIEINPRFGGGYPLSYLSGANFSLWIIKEYLLQTQINEYYDKWKNNLLMLRYDDEVLVNEYNN